MHLFGSFTLHLCNQRLMCHFGHGRRFTSIDFGATWQQASLQDPVNRLAWQHWHATVTFPQAGYHEIWVRAVDEEGVSQPVVLPGWNPRGYLNNACHRIAVLVTA